MLSEKEIKGKYKVIHDKLAEDYYAKKALSKEDFSTQHSKVWSGMEAELIAGGFIKVREPPRDLAAEIDTLGERLTALEL